jgi:mono/diheme cytochrome c family protein
MIRTWIITFIVAGLAGSLLANAQAKADLSRGELLYTTYCIACHSTQMHWRDKKIATNWSILKAQVRQWQRTSGLGWGEEDVTAVARYLNVRFYHFPVPEIASSQTKDNAKLTREP